MKNYNNNMSPVKSEAFIWIAEYNKQVNSRDYLPEFEFIDGGCGNIRHSFDEISKEDLKEFGLIGSDYKFSFDSLSGNFYLMNEEAKIEVRYYDKENDKEIKFMYSEYAPFNDIIMFRTIESFLIDGQTGSADKVIEYGLGYKKTLEDFSVNFVFHIPMEINKTPYFKFKIVSKEHIDGEFRLYINDKISMTIETELNKNIGKEFKIDVK